MTREGEAAEEESASLRRALVEELARREVIRSPAIRDAFLRVPRERFLPAVAAERGLAAVYRDEAIITHRTEQGMALSSSSQPGMMATMLENLRLAPGLRVLEIGAGTGYNSALLAELTGGAVSVEVDAEIAGRARDHVAAGGHPVRVEVGDGMEGWPAGAPYDRIVVTATPRALPLAWQDQLAPGGLLEVPLVLGLPSAGVGLVVTFRRDRAELVSVAMTPGWFVSFRAADGHLPEESRPRLGWFDSRRGRHRGASLRGPGLAGLAEPARRRLLTAIVAGPRRLGAVRATDLGLALLVVAAAPPRRLAVMQPAAIGLVDAGGGAAMLAHRWRDGRFGGARLEVYGEAAGAEAELRRLIDEWRRAGRPALADLEVRVAFGRPPTGVDWRLPPIGEARVGVVLRRRRG